MLHILDMVDLMPAHSTPSFEFCIQTFFGVGHLLDVAPELSSFKSLTALIGTIGSSGVVEAIWDYWNYFEPIREYGPPSCIVNQQKLTNIVDNIIIGSKNNQTINELKAAFGLQNLT